MQSQWAEIEREHAEGQTANYPPDIVSFVFLMKMKHMMKEVIDNEIFGTFMTHVERINQAQYACTMGFLQRDAQNS